MLTYPVGRVNPAVVIAAGLVAMIFNAANEFAVARFLKKEITFTQIYDLIERAMSNVTFNEAPDLDTVLKTEKEVYEYLRSVLDQWGSA